jgi:DsbC/DsbD-like thiol-disulfide interchange protein
MLTGDKRYRDEAVRLFGAFQGLMEQAPRAMESMLLAVAMYVDAAAEPRASISEPGASASGASVRKVPVTVELLAGRSALPRGTSVPLALRFSIAPGWHICAHAEGEAAATRFALAGTPLGELRTERYPAAETLRTPDGGEQQVYAGTVGLGAVLAVNSAAPLGDQVLQVRVHFQACSERVCQAPEDVVLALPVRVVERNAATEATHVGLFRELHLAS